VCGSAVGGEYLGNIEKGRGGRGFAVASLGRITAGLKMGFALLFGPDPAKGH
jgi:hypothetical protein